MLKQVSLVVATAIAAVLLPVPANAVVVEPFTKRYEAALYGDFITIGNTVIGCPTDKSVAAQECMDTQAEVQNFNNNRFMMQRINTAALGLPAFDSSTGELTIPAGATVAYARLFWGGNDGFYKGPSSTLKRCDIQQTSPPEVVRSPGDPKDMHPIVRVTGTPETEVPIQNYNDDPASLGGPHYYTAESDVTSLFKNAPTGSPTEIAVGNIWAVDGKGCVAGWSLTVVYKFAGPTAQAPSRRNIYIWGGHVLQRSQDAPTSVNVTGFDRFGTAPVRASATIYEGDRATAGDTFLVNGVNIKQPNSGATNNFFVGDADGAKNPDHLNNLSIDANEFDIPPAAIPEGATSATLTFRTTNDTYVPQQLAISIPIPDVEVSKSTPSKGTVTAGEKLTYTITVENLSDVNYPNAKFSDDLSDVLDDADLVGAPTATLGTATVVAPLINWVGDLPPGQSATIKYTVVIKPKGSGDGQMLNAVVSEGERTECEKGSTDPGCGSKIMIVDPIPVTGRPITPLVFASILLIGAGALLRRVALRG